MTKLKEWVGDSLDVQTSEFRDILLRGVDLLVDQYQQIDDQLGYHYFDPAEVASWFDETLPDAPMDLDELFQLIQDKVVNTATGNLGPHMYAYVMSGGSQISLVAEQIASCLNQNIGKWHLGPAMTEIEKRVVQWGADMIGYQHQAGGVMLSGGSAANLAGLTVARNLFFESEEIRRRGLFGRKPFTLYTSSEVHGCIDKSVELLGIGTDHIRKISVDDQYMLRTDELRSQINQDIADGLQPWCIVGTAGTVNTGAIDDLDALADLAEEYQMWFHVDGAYGGLAAQLDGLSSYYQGISRADSVAIDFHKWLYQPFEAGCVLVKDWSELKRSFYKKAEYLSTDFEGDGRLNFNEHNFQLSRNCKAFKVWMSIKAYGMKRIAAMIKKDIDLTAYLADQITKSSDFEIKARGPLAIVCFSYTAGSQDPALVEHLNKRLIPALESDGRVFITGTNIHGEFVLRACLINHRKTKASVDHLLEVIRDVGKSLLD